MSGSSRAKDTILQPFGSDDGTHDIIVSEIIRTNELQAWFVCDHLVRNN